MIASKEQQDVLAFHQKFDVPMASKPSLLDNNAFSFRLKFLQEELDEFRDGHSIGDMHGAADALVDLAYVLHGTVLMMGLPWELLWDEVQRANMAKVRATHIGQSKRKSALDVVVKPEGWQAPDHTAALGTGPWPVLRTVMLKPVKLSWTTLGEFPQSATVEAASPEEALLVKLGELQAVGSEIVHLSARLAVSDGQGGWL